MKIAITGYHGTGSSAILDLLSEYEGTTEGGLHSYEHVPLYFPNGLFDLEYKLLHGNDPHRSDEAIKSFRKAMYELNDLNFGWFGSYGDLYGNEFKQNVDAFIDSLVQFSCEAEWYGYYIPPHFSAAKFIKDCVKTLIPGKKINGKFGIVPMQLTRQTKEISFVSEETFYQNSKRFIENYFRMINKEEKPVLLLDHLMVPHNANRIDRFFDDDFRLIIVERDARDLFVLCKYVWTRMGMEPPYPTDPDAFLKFWTNMRKAEQIQDHPHVLRVWFEDLVYRYDETVAKIEAFTGLTPQQHIAPKTRFDPARSINNTQNFLIDRSWAAEVASYDQHPEYLYSFPYERIADINDTFDS